MNSNGEDPLAGYGAQLARPDGQTMPVPPGVPSTMPSRLDALHTTAHAAVVEQRNNTFVAGFTGQRPVENFIK
jgi:hypothetical protein